MCRYLATHKIFINKIKMIAAIKKQNNRNKNNN